MPTPEQARAVADLGAWPLLILLIGLAIWGLFKSRPIWVPGWLYLRERAAREKADEQAERNAEALEQSAAAYAALAADYATLAAAYDSLADSMPRDRRASARPKGPSGGA